MEEWRDVGGYEGLYQVSSLGQVKRLYNAYHKAPEHTLKPGKMGGNGGVGNYLFVVLSKSSQHKNHYIHRLVAQVFIPNPDNLPEVDHINQNKLDNSVSNLRWCSKSLNHMNKTHKLGKSGHRYICQQGGTAWYVKISRRIDGKSTRIVNQSFPTLDDAISFRDQIISTL